MRTHLAALAALLGGLGLACSSPAGAAETAAGARTDDAGIVRYPFPGTAPTLACAPLTVCTISLQNGESVSGLATGDSERWIIATAPSGPGGSTPLVLVKPKESALHTNLVIATTAHVYYVNLISTRSWANAKIAFYYPGEELAAANAEAAKRAADEATNAPPPGPPEKAEYTIRGDSRIAPQSVYEDGAHTYVRYDVLPTDLPVVVAVAADGTNQLANYRLLDRTFIVDGVPPGLDLILNAGTGKHGRGELRVAIRHI